MNNAELKPSENAFAKASELAKQHNRFVAIFQVGDDFHVEVIHCYATFEPMFEVIDCLVEPNGRSYREMVVWS